MQLFPLVVFTVFCIAASVQAAYYLLLFARFAFAKQPHYVADVLPAVSVVVCCKNDGEALAKLLKLLTIQRYPSDYEIVIVNDQSTDNTLDVVAEFAARNHCIRLFHTTNENKSTGKKMALRLGIENARYDTIVVTDADCRPASTNWLQLMAGSYVSDTTLVLGYAPFLPQRGWLNKLVRYENVLTATQYFSFALAGMPYMGVGRNMSFRKRVYLGYRSSLAAEKIAGGDDDLFVNATAQGRTTALCLHTDSFVFSAAKNTWSEWLQQKQRHVRAGFHYRWYHQVLLFVFALSKFLFYTTMPVLFTLAGKALIVLLPVALLLLLIQVVQQHINKKLHQTDLGFILPLDVCFAAYLLLIFLLTSVMRKDTWKETNQPQK